MRMELIQPFINAADAVLSETLQSTAKIGDVSMEEETYRRRGVAAMITIVGDIEGRVIFDLDPPTAAKIAGHFAGGEVEATDEIVR
ncbi:MAG: chemotaxis protein CheX, partial [Acidobacteria bacterium]